VRQALVARSPFRLDDSGELPIATALETAFRRYDPASRQLPSTTSELNSHSGTVSFLEFERALLSIGVRLTDREVAEVVTDLGIERSGRIRYMGMCVRQPSSVDSRVIAARLLQCSGVLLRNDAAASVQHGSRENREGGRKGGREGTATG
jgi:hypothetical protein